MKHVQKGCWQPEVVEFQFASWRSCPIDAWRQTNSKAGVWTVSQNLVNCQDLAHWKWVWKPIAMVSHVELETSLDLYLDEVGFSKNCGWWLWYFCFFWVYAAYMPQFLMFFLVLRNGRARTETTWLGFLVFFMIPLGRQAAWHCELTVSPLPQFFNLDESQWYFYGVLFPFEYHGCIHSAPVYLIHVYTIKNPPSSQGISQGFFPSSPVDLRGDAYRGAVSLYLQIV